LTKPKVLYFYTTPPLRLAWPWILVSLPSLGGLRGKTIFKRALHIIIDSGVDKYFMKEKLKDYPPSYRAFSPYEFKSIQNELGERVRITVPDFPDDYSPGQTYDGGKDNVDRTIENIKRYTGIFPDINWMPVAQAKYMDFDGFRSRLPEIGSYVDRYGWVGIGTVCKTHDLDFIAKCCKALAKEFPDAHKHAFGATMESYPIIRHYVESFDSSAYSFYTGRRGQPKTKNQVEREVAFVSWMFTMTKKVDMEKLELPSESVLT